MKLSIARVLYRLDSSIEARLRMIDAIAIEIKQGKFHSRQLCVRKVQACGQFAIACLASLTLIILTRLTGQRHTCFMLTPGDVVLLRFADESDPARLLDPNLPDLLGTYLGGKYSNLDAGVGPRVAENDTGIAI